MEEKVLNLCEILKGCEGVKLYSTIFGDVKLKEILDCGMIRVTAEEDDVDYNYYDDGTFVRYNNAECTLFPSKEQRDWSKFEKPIKEGTPIMCCEDMDDLEREYWHYRKYTEREMIGWLYVIPFDKFNPLDIEESLKYNIQK